MNQEKLKEYFHYRRVLKNTQLMCHIPVELLEEVILNYFKLKIFHRKLGSTSSDSPLAFKIMMVSCGFILMMFCACNVM